MIRVDHEPFPEEIMNQPAVYPDPKTLTEWRRDFHSHPEIAFEETRTSQRIVEILREHGLDPVTGLGGGTGVVVTIEGNRGPGRAIGLRADIDALPIEELNDVDYRSSIPDTGPAAVCACG